MKRLLIALERRTLRTKLLVGFIGLMSLTVAIGVDALIGQRRLSNEIQHLYEKELLGISAIKEARFEYAQMGRGVRMVILARSPDERERAVKQVATFELAIQQAIDTTRKLTFRDEGKVQLGKFEENYGLYKQNVDRVVALTLKDKIDEAQVYVSSMDFQKPGIAANTNLAEMARIKEVGAQEAVKRAGDVAEYEEFTTLVLLIGGSLLGLLVGGLIARSVRRPTENIRQSVEQLAHGQLDEVIPHTDYPNEIGDLARAIEVLQREARLMEAQR